MKENYLKTFVRIRFTNYTTYSNSQTDLGKTGEQVAAGQDHERRTGTNQENESTGGLVINDGDDLGT